MNCGDEMRIFAMDDNVFAATTESVCEREGLCALRQCLSASRGSSEGGGDEVGLAEKEATRIFSLFLFFLFLWIQLSVYSLNFDVCIFGAVPSLWLCSTSVYQRYNNRLPGQYFGDAIDRCFFAESGTVDLSFLFICTHARFDLENEYICGVKPQN